MAYTTPPTFNSGDVLAASDLNILGDDIVYLKGITDGISASGVQVNRGTNQSIPDSTATAMSFTAENFDFGGWWSSGTNVVVPAGAIPSGFTTIIVTGNARAYFASDPDGYRRIAVLVNGSIVSQKTVDANSTGSSDDELTFYTEVAAADVITMEVTHTAGSSINATALLTVMRYAPAA